MRDFAGEGLKWIVLTTQPNREAFAIENLLRQDYNVYCPMISKNIRHARRSCEVKRPLFPGYLFVEQRSPFIGRSLLGTYGVRTVVRCGDRPSLLPAGFVAGLKARETDGVILSPKDTLVPGQAVKIDGGVFDGLIGTIIEVRENDRVLLLLDFLNTQSKVNIDARTLRSA
jgi:transcriptional antiterminator RfaH